MIELDWINYKYSFVLLSLKFIPGKLSINTAFGRVLKLYLKKKKKLINSFGFYDNFIRLYSCEEKKSTDVKNINILLDLALRSWSRTGSCTFLAAPAPGFFLDWLLLLVFFLNQLRLWLQGVKNNRLRLRLWLPSPDYKAILVFKIKLERV